MKYFKLDRKQVWVALGTLAVLAVLYGLLFFFLGRPILRSIGEPEQFQRWVDDLGGWAYVCVIGLTAIQGVVSIFPIEIINVGAGYAFGCPMGTLLILTGIALGSAAIFFIVRHLGMKVVEFFVPREKIDELAFIKSEKRRTLFVLITFLIPGTPKRTISYFMGMTSMPAATFVLVSTLARLPTIAISTYGGEALGSQKYIMALIIFVAMIVAGIAGMLVYRRIWKSKKSPKA